MTMKLIRGGRFAPGCYIIARKQADGTFDETSATESVLVQTDWEFPWLAQTFGWRLGENLGGGCTHDASDGTVTCEACGTTPGEFISAAIDWLDDHDGDLIEDGDESWFAPDIDIGRERFGDDR